MKSRPASSAMRASLRLSAQLPDQRSGTIVTARPDEQLAPNSPIFSRFLLYMAARSGVVASRVIGSEVLGRGVPGRGPGYCCWQASMAVVAVVEAAILEVGQTHEHDPDQHDRDCHPFAWRAGDARARAAPGDGPRPGRGAGEGCGCWSQSAGRDAAYGSLSAAQGRD